MTIQDRSQQRVVRKAELALTFLSPPMTIEQLIVQLQPFSIC